MFGFFKKNACSPYEQQTAHADVCSTQHVPVRANADDLCLVMNQKAIRQSMILRIGIMLEYSNPCFLKNSWDSALTRSVSKVIRLKFFCLANSNT